MRLVRTTGLLVFPFVLWFAANLSAQERVINPVVPNAALGPFRHGTFPSLESRGQQWTHIGVDLIASEGSPVYAFGDGTVVAVIARGDPEFSWAGNAVMIEHPTVPRNMYTIYLHLKDTPTVKPGDPVQGGRIQIGEVGRTGAAHDVAHVHFEIRYFEEWLSAWGNIYAPGDQRDSPYLRTNWEDPLVYFQRFPSGLRQTSPASAHESRYENRTFSEWQSELQDLSPEVRKRAVDALGHFGEQAARLLVPFLGDPDFAVRVAASFALRRIGLPAVPALRQALAHSDFRVRSNAAFSIWLIGPAAWEAVPELTKNLADSEPLVRQRAATALGRIGPRAKEAVPALVRAIETHEDLLEIKNGALGALIKLDPEAVIPALVRALRSERPSAGREAVGTLHLISAIVTRQPAADVWMIAAAATSPEVKAFFKAVESVRHVLELGFIPYIPEIAQGLQHPGLPVLNQKVMIVQMLRFLGPKAKTAAPVLRELSASPDPIVRELARQALEGIEGH